MHGFVNFPHLTLSPHSAMCTFFGNQRGILFLASLTAISIRYLNPIHHNFIHFQHSLFLSNTTLCKQPTLVSSKPSPTKFRIFNIWKLHSFFFHQEHSFSHSLLCHHTKKGMFSWLASKIFAGLKRLWRVARMRKHDDDDDDDDDESSNSLIWRKDLEKHSCGEFSFAVVQANEVIEDHSQVETASNAIFVGVYDGHGGPEAARFTNRHLFHHLIRIAQENGTISEEVLRGAVSDTEVKFQTLVRCTYKLKPEMATIGSCCLVGVIWKGTLYIANVGDSRAVIGSTDVSNKIIGEQLTEEHNARREEVREQLRTLYPQDSQIVVMDDDGTWRVKGVIQVSRSIGDAYLKRPAIARSHLPEPISRPVLSARPSLYSRVLQPADKFLIFASDGLWEHITNQKAAEIVHKNPRTGIARKLLKAALKKVASKHKMKYKDLQKFLKGSRRNFHDDITVIVVFIDHEFLGKKVTVPEQSFKGLVDSVATSKFRNIQELM